MVEKKPQTVLVYRRTHTGDPGSAKGSNDYGVFGCNCCMGRVREWEYDAVIGIGGKSAEPICEGIAEKITWIGIWPNKKAEKGEDNHSLVKFEIFALWDSNGRKLSEVAPKLAKHMFVKGRVRRTGKFYIDSNDSTYLSDINTEINYLLKEAEKNPNSLGVPLESDEQDSSIGFVSSSGCSPKKVRKST